MHFGTKSPHRLRQLPIQPMLADLAVAFALGMLPMMLATVYTIMRALSRWSLYDTSA